MNLIYEKVEAMTINLYEEEKAALEIVDNVLLKLQMQLALKRKEMVAMETGEVIDANDIAKARGILDGIANLVAWQLKNE